jgi:hypothetical protein
MGAIAVILDKRRPGGIDPPGRREWSILSFALSCNWHRIEAAGRGLLP